MDYVKELEKYAPAHTDAQVAKEVAKIKMAANRNGNTDVYKFCYSAIDLTTLSCTDSVESVQAFVRKAVDFYEKYPHIPNVASICVYPSFVETVGLEIDGTPMRITSVAGAFPASQSFVEVKALEVAMAIENGADEIDIVLNPGMMLAGHDAEAASEVELLREEAKDVVLKVIIESGALKTPELIRRASLISMFAGADFIKTSTGKVDVNATPVAAYVMCECIAKFYEATGKKIGFKPAGGISSAADALCYYSIVSSILGKEWLNKELFRFGVSRVANNILAAVEQKTVAYF